MPPFKLATSAKPCSINSSAAARLRYAGVADRDNRRLLDQFVRPVRPDLRAEYEERRGYAPLPTPWVPGHRPAGPTGRSRFGPFRQRRPLESSCPDSLFSAKPCVLPVVLVSLIAPSSMAMRLASLRLFHASMPPSTLIRFAYPRCCKQTGREAGAIPAATNDRDLRIGGNGGLAPRAISPA